jgi:hypothetical protein
MQNVRTIIVPQRRSFASNLYKMSKNDQNSLKIEKQHTHICTNRPAAQPCTVHLFNRPFGILQKTMQ